MNEAIALTFAVLAGAALGSIFFGGLWWTVRRGAASAQPALWFFCSLSLRMCIVLAGVYVVAGADWKRLLLCLMGFTAARVIVTRRTRTMEAGHAPQP